MTPVPIRPLHTRTLYLVFAAALILTPVYPAAASSVCIVLSNESAQFKETVQGFQTAWAQHGFSSEITIHLLSRDGDQPLQIARSLEQSKAAYILSLGSQAARILSQENFGIPLIIGLVFSATEIADVANSTGVYLEIPIEVQVSTIMRLFPKARRVGVLYSKENEPKIMEAARLFQKNGLSLEAQETLLPQHIPYALESVRKKADLLWGLMDKVVLTPETARQILLFSLRNELPFIGPSENWARAGAVAAFSWDFADLGAQCAEIILAMINGTPAAEIPPVGPREIAYTLNMRTAAQMKMDFDRNIINDSKQVFRGD